MRGDAAAFFAEHGFGAVERAIPLVGTLPADGAGRLAAELCLGARGVFLVAAKGRFVGRAIDAGDPASLQYEMGRLRDRLIVDGSTLTVPAGKARSARALLAIGRLRRDGYRAEPLPLPRDRYAEELPEAAEWLVSALIPVPDVCLAVLAVDDSARMKSELGPDVVRTTYCVLSAERLLRVGLSELGDLQVEDLSTGSFGLSVREGRSFVRLGTEEWPVSVKKAALLAELLELAPLEPAERLYEGARRLWLGRAAHHKSSRATSLLAAANDREHARAAFALALIQGAMHGTSALKSGLPNAVAAFRRAGLPDDAAAEIFERWAIPETLGRTAVTLLSTFGVEAEPWAVVLHRAVRTKSSEAQAEATRADIELAEHELVSGEPVRARALAEARLLQLDPDEEAVLAPDRVGVAHLNALRLHDVLRREGERRGVPDVNALAALARLEPSNIARWRALADASSTEARERRLIERAVEVLDALTPGGLETTGDGPTELPEPLPRSRLDEHLRHPLARSGGRIATRLTELVASTPEPDLGFLRDFCEELSMERYPDAARALSRAVCLLGLPAVRTYVSHGARSVGMRAFGAREPFVLVGQSHLAEGPAALRGRELDFALTAELSHLAFGHQRVTMSEVWTGAAGKTRDALVALGVVLPLVGEIAGLKTQRLIAKLTPDALARAAEGALKLEEWFGSTRPGEPGLGQRNEELIAAHRLVQLSADRAGLVNCRRVAPALRALLALRAEYRLILEASLDRGLIEALAREPETPAVSDLRVRIRALVAFYLSSDFDVLAPGDAAAGRALELPSAR